ncbi:MAG: YitT family protein [Floccifex sp.]
MKNTILNIIGSSLLAFGVCAFIVPFDIIVGGATGLSIIGHKLFGLNMSTIVLFINVVCLPIGYIFGNKELVFGSILSSLVYPAALAFFEQIPMITNIVDNIFLKNTRAVDFLRPRRDSVVVSLEEHDFFAVCVCP